MKTATLAPDRAERQVHRYRPLGSALELFGARDPEVLLSGAAGTGKSRACLEKVHAMCMLNPGMRAVILRKTAVSLTNTGIVTFREHVAKEALATGELRYYGGSGQEPACYKYSNGSTIVCGGMDKATKIMSSEYDVAYCQEATEFTENDWEAITTRLRHGAVSFQQLLADCNPDAPHHWLKQRCDRGQTRIIYCRHEDNPVLYCDIRNCGSAKTDTKDCGSAKIGIACEHGSTEAHWTPKGAAYIALLDALTGVRYQRLRLGQWAAAEGLVYDTFDPAVHLHKPIAEPPLTWRRFWAVDFGYTNPFVWQSWAEDPDGRLYLYREVYMTGRLVEDHAATILRLQRTKRGREPQPYAIVCDHDAEGRATLEAKLGMSTVPAHKSVLEGIEAVKARLKVQGDGRPRLYLCRDALYEPDPTLTEARKPNCTQQEVLEYVWGPGVVKEAPLKENDHGVDAMRYLIAYVDLKGRPRARFL